MPKPTRPDLPAARPPSSPPVHHDSSRPADWEKRAFDAALEQVKTYREQLEVEADAREAELTALREEFGRVQERNDQLEDELRNFKRSSLEDDYARDARLREAQRDLTVLAERVEKLNRPLTEATGAAGAATVINAARKKELLEKAAYVLALVLLALWNLVAGRGPAAHSDPTEAVPVPRVQPAGTGFAGRP
jgi:ribosomal protein S21